MDGSNNPTRHVTKTVNEAQALYVFRDAFVHQLTTSGPEVSPRFSLRTQISRGRHSRESGNPFALVREQKWIPAFAGMTASQFGGLTASWLVD
jgi:hypothetical protein